MAEYHAVETKAEGTGFWVRAAKATREEWENEDANKTGEIQMEDGNKTILRGITVTNHTSLQVCIGLHCKYRII